MASFPDVDSPAVAVILVNWNSWGDSIECVAALLAQRYANFHIFLVDNDSSDQSIERIQQWCAAPRAASGWRTHEGVQRLTDRAAPEPVIYRTVTKPDHELAAPPQGCRLTLVRSGANRGFAGGCNVGIRAAGLNAFEYFWFLNNDTVVHCQALDALIRRALHERSIGMVGSTLRYYDAPDTVQAMGGAYLDRATAESRHIGEGRGLDEVPQDPATIERRLAYIFGASMLVSTRFVREVGVMQEDYFLYYEEIDWAMRGGGKFTLGYAADSHVFHKSGASSSRVLPLFSARLYYRNRVRFVSRFLPAALGAVKRQLTIEFLRHIARGRWRMAGVVASVRLQAREIAAHAANPS